MKLSRVHIIENVCFIVNLCHRK